MNLSMANRIFTANTITFVNRIWMVQMWGFFPIHAKKVPIKICNGLSGIELFLLPEYWNAKKTFDS